MAFRPKPFFAEEKKSQERGLEKKGKDPFHRKRLSDHAAGRSGKLGPVRAELEFHGNAGDNAQCETDSEYPGPKSRRAVPRFVAGLKRRSLQDENQKGEAHRELGENVMKGDGEGEMQAMYGQRVFHGPSADGTYLHKVKTRPRRLPLLVAQNFAVYFL